MKFQKIYHSIQLNYNKQFNAKLIYLKKISVNIFENGINEKRNIFLEINYFFFIFTRWQHKAIIISSRLQQPPYVYKI